MAILSPSNLETFDYGTPGWSSIETSNWQKVNQYLAKIWIMIASDATATGKLVKYNGSTGKWELTGFTEQEVMTKTIYDANNNGIVDKAETINDGAGNVVTAVEIKGAVANSHTHPNKALLDTYTQTNEDIADAVAKRHTQNTDTQLKGGVVTVDANDNVGIGTTVPTAKLDINGSTGYNQLRIRTPYTPTSSADANGNVGDIAWDDNYIYVKTSTGWKRVPLSSW